VWRHPRDLALFVSGLLLLAHETFEPSPDPTLVAAALALMGLPAALRKGGGS